MRDNIMLKLKMRAESVLNSREENFRNEVKFFYDYTSTVGLFKAILDELEQVGFDLNEHLKQGMHRRFISYPDEYIKKIAMCNEIMKLFARKEIGVTNGMFMHITSSRNMDNITEAISQQYFYPLYQYFCEKISDNNTMLYLLDRYRHRTEWFHKKRLYDIYINDTTHGEDLLTIDLQEYLHDQGIDYPFSTPLSPSGRSDLIGLIETDDPLVLEVKIFNTDQGYGKDYIRKGLTQAYRYAVDYGKQVGYLLVFNTDQKDINFEIKENERIKSIETGGKIIYIVVVDLYNGGLTASQQKKPLPIFIEDSYLKNIEE